MKKVLLHSLFPFIPIAVGISLLIVSCHCKKKTTSAASATAAATTSTTLSDEEIAKIQEQQKKYADEGYIKARIVSMELDGCSYMILLGDGSKLEPTNLLQEFKKDKLDVWIKYTAKKGGMSICMAGQLVDITGIQLRK